MRHLSRWLIMAAVAVVVGTALVARAAEDHDRKVTLDQLPAAARSAILKALGGHKLTDLEAVDEHGATVYEATYTADGKPVEVTVDQDGKVLAADQEQGEHGANTDEGKEEHEAKSADEQKLTLDQVPAPVKATLLKEAAGAKIEDLTAETKEGVTVYEASFAADSQDVEVKVAADGKLLSRKVEKDDEAHETKASPAPQHAAHPDGK